MPPPPLDLAALRAAVEDGAVFAYLTFWGHRPGPGGALGPSCLSQWWPCRFTVDGQRYASAEQLMMTAKARLFGDREREAEMLATDDPGRIKALGRKVRGYDEAVWAAARFDVVTRGNVAKFGQDPALRAYLLGTGEAILVEASPVDTVWGIGLAADHPDAADPRRWRGENLLGFALVRARAILRGELAPP